MHYLKLLLVALLVLVASEASAQGRSGWLEELDRTHSQAGPQRHVHSRGQIEAVDVEGGIVTMWHWELGSPDRSIWMPGMRMVFHTTNRAMGRGAGAAD
jgi:Cu/Ag efflux protein CusF